MTAIALLTDFGLADPYVGQMKGVLNRIAPQHQVIDISHEVRPQSVQQAAFFLQASYRHFAKGTVLVCVIDPGVGTEREILCCRIEDRIFLAPNNGLLSGLLADFPDTPVYALDLSGFPDASVTFHGRDIFCPLAALLSDGASPASLGALIDKASLPKPEWSQPSIAAGEIHCHVQHIDRFGNVVLNLDVLQWRKQLEEWANLVLALPHAIEIPFVRTFSDLPLGETGILEGSQGYFELACNSTSAAERLSLRIGDRVSLQRCSPDK